MLTGKLSVSLVQDRYIIEITEFTSSDISARLSGFTGLDWRSSVAEVAIDPDYDGSIFEVVLVDNPESATDFVKGSYPVHKDQVGGCVAVRITDILGESVILTQSMDNK